MGRLLQRYQVRRNGVDTIVVNSNSNTVPSRIPLLGTRARRDFGVRSDDDICPFGRQYEVEETQVSISRIREDDEGVPRKRRPGGAVNFRTGENIRLHCHLRTQAIPHVLNVPTLFDLS